MNKLLRKYSTGKSVLIWFVVCNLVYVLMLAYTIPMVRTFAGGMNLFDMMPTGYDLNYALELFNALGEEGRHAYLWVQLPVDMLYPALFALSYSLLLVWLLQKIDKHQSRLFYLAYLPFIAAMADYLENLGIIVLLKQFPDITRSSVEMISHASVVKSSTTTVYFLVVLIVLLAILWNWLKKRN